MIHINRMGGGGYYRRISVFLVLFLILTIKAAAGEVLETRTVESVPLTPKTAWYSHFFVAGGLQTFIAVSRLKEYTEPKPGYRFAGGYTFLHSRKSGRHSLPLYLETGHSVISGTNPLVRMFDFVPLTVQLAYEYSPVPYFSLGAFVGTGVYFSSILHYPTIMDILTNSLKKTRGIGAAFNAGITIGGNILERGIELRAAFSCDIILEKPQPIPLPSFQLGVRVYPHTLYVYTRKKQTPETVTELPPELPQFVSIFVYFEPERATLDVNAKAELKKAAEILKANSDIFIVFEGSTAPFGSQAGRIKLENSRILTAAEYLKNNCGIEADRIIYTEPFKNQEAKQEETSDEEHYTQFRYVKLRFVRLQYNPNEGENIYKTDTAGNLQKIQEKEGVK